MKNGLLAEWLLADLFTASLPVLSRLANWRQLRLFFLLPFPLFGPQRPSATQGQRFEIAVGELKDPLVGETAGQGDPNPADTDADLSSDLEQFGANRSAMRLGQVSSC
jgi:hypothetical protein